MFNVSEFFQQANDLLPSDKKAKTVSCYPLPYDGYFEVFVETTDGARYRALANATNTLSNFVKLEFPHAQSECKVK
uniref:Uncharacterized protein n=1 Tax=uncultured Elusimicrobia bacterium TaxID=699876 RepID=A0A650EPA5_9BACT|nr:hypothetical protein Elusimicrob1349_1940 [uncultured Elusimicrobia bacterium]